MSLTKSFTKVTSPVRTYSWVTISYTVHSSVGAFLFSYLTVQHNVVKVNNLLLISARNKRYPNDLYYNISREKKVKTRVAELHFKKGPGSDPYFQEGSDSDPV